jgi:hypothetical protein
LLSASLGLAQDPPEPAAQVQIIPSPPTAFVPPSGDGDLEGRIPHESRSFDAFVDSAGDRDLNRQISYETRFLDLSADFWRNLMKDGLHPAGGEDEAAWILDEDDTRRLINITPGDIRSSLIQAPKITSFEGIRTTVINSYKQNYISRLEPIKTPKSLAFRPIVEAVKIGTTIDLTGSILQGEIRLKADIRDTSLVALHTLKRHEEHEGMELAGEYQIPTTKERHHRGTSQIPEGFTLVVSLGFYEQPDPLSGVARMASGLIESFGGARIEPAHHTRERLVLITPRRIVLEEEEERLGIPAPQAAPTASRGGGR